MPLAITNEAISFKRKNLLRIIHIYFDLILCNKQTSSCSSPLMEFFHYSEDVSQTWTAKFFLSICCYQTSHKYRMVLWGTNERQVHVFVCARFSFLYLLRCHTSLIHSLYGSTSLSMLCRLFLSLLYRLDKLQIHTEGLYVICNVSLSTHMIYLFFVFQICTCNQKEKNCLMTLIVDLPWRSLVLLHIAL